WLQAYENHYLDQLLNALTDGYGRDCSGEEATSAQLVFCMDDREEGFRRHLEEIDPSVETFGAAAHFAVPHLSRGYGSEKVTALCPVGVVPLQEVREQVLPEQKAAGDRRLERAAGRTRLIDMVHQESRRNLFSTLPLMAAAVPTALFALIGKVFAPLGFARLVERLRINYEGKVDTGIEFCAEEGGEVPSPEQPQQGFTDDEQLDRVEVLLRNIGLVDNFSPLVVIMAHGSSSQNNPHLAAYDCGACSGRHSGPNARLVCAMANRPEIRARLAEQGITIPSGTWFLAGEHNTCTEGIEWYDLNLLPEALGGNFKRLRQALAEASERHAHERCRRLASAPDAPTNAQALKHIVSRAYDFSQARPELGHATNAAAFIGRRTMSRGTFYDRRVFLISYDYTTDPTGEVLERLLLANGPVGAGISLEYYFSTVDNDNYGCGSKITHNITGMFGVMDGAGSD
ncbi:MAG: putative inorganic carbon transporter subunit DabA, partial [Candidatus Sedimenticola sp. (ex Thyasira tokunagai)]